MRSVVPALILTPFMAVSSALAGESLNYQDESIQSNYSLGFQIGSDFKSAGMDLNPDAVAQGIRDAFSGADPKVLAKDIHITLMKLRERLTDQERQRTAGETQERLAEGTKFMDENGKREGVITTESGLQYRVINEGTGKSPGPNDMVTVDYRGTLVDGTEFDSSFKRGQPANLRLNGVIKGWTEGLAHVKEGGKVMLFVPPALAYGAHGPLANRTLVFEVTLIAVGQPQPDAATGSDSAPERGK